MLSKSDLARLRAFAVVAETLNFSRAAERLAISPSALSQTMRALEARIGTRLVNRTTRSVSLTIAGERLLEGIGPALEHLDAAMTAVREGEDQPFGIVRLHCFRRAADLFVAPILASFGTAYPNIVLDVTADDTPVDLVAGRFDAAIRLGETIEQDIVALRLGPDMRQVVVGSPDYLARHGTPGTPRDLTRHTCLRWRWDGHETPEPWEFFENGRTVRIAVDGPLILNDRNMETRAALEGIGLAHTVEERVWNHIQAGRLISMLEGSSSPFAGYFLCYPQQRQMASALRAFIDHLKEAAA